MFIDQETVELIHQVKLGFGLLLCSREAGTMQAGVGLLRGAYRAAWQRNAAACARFLTILHSKDHGAGDGFPQVLRVLGSAVNSSARFAAAHPRPMLLLLAVAAGLFASYQGYKPQQPA